ncbi:MAG TPA: shikimate dehydrogenase [Syntrophomonas sp.]|nr:shikimate dehydrogenase [Syntrophomonas sp.]
MQKSADILLGLLGNPVEHSLSPLMQNSAIRWLGLPYVYLPFCIEPEHLPAAVAAIRALSMGGVNVTIPFKEAVIPYLDALSEDARLCGAVNLIHNQGGKLLGLNTDGEGFIRSLREEDLHPQGQFVLIGAGGAARAIAGAISQFPIEQIVFLDIDPARAHHLAGHIAQQTGCCCQAAVMNRENFAAASAQADFIVNCSSVGMFPHIEGCPVDTFAQAKDSAVVYDLIYNPLQTRFLQLASTRGLKTVSGLSMLVHQGALSLEILTGCQAPVSHMKAVVSDYYAQQQRIYAG